jgi:hypothetical protein
MGQPARWRGQVDLEVDCSGAVRVEVQGHTEAPVVYSALLSTAEGLRLAEGKADLVARATLDGRIATRQADGRPAVVDMAVDSTLTAPTGQSAPAQRFYATDISPRWQLDGGEPGRLQGAWSGLSDLTIPAEGEQPALRVGARGSWQATRHRVEDCPWRGRASARGALVEGQMHEEAGEFTFRPGANGQFEGEGTGRARVYGGTPGGCEYSGGGGIAFRVAGRLEGGRFQLHLTDDDQPQLLVATDCPSGRYVAPQGALTTAFGVVNLAEAPSASGSATIGGLAGEGVLDVTVEPEGELAPP